MYYKYANLENRTELKWAKIALLTRFFSFFCICLYKLVSLYILSYIIITHQGLVFLRANGPNVERRSLAMQKIFIKPSDKFLLMY